MSDKHLSVYVLLTGFTDLRGDTASSKHICLHKLPISDNVETTSDLALG